MAVAIHPSPRALNNGDYFKAIDDLASRIAATGRKAS